MKIDIKRIPFISKRWNNLKRKLKINDSFTNSEEYWIKRYASGGTSGDGSYNRLAEFKSQVINDYIEKNKIQTIIELGCGDGNQLQYFKIQNYIGFDISPEAIERCRKKYRNDSSKEFYLIEELNDQKADATLSLDVLYHLIEDDVYDLYLQKLFDASKKYVIIYSSNFEDSDSFSSHVKSRKFSDWIQENRPDFKLKDHIPNKYPYKPGDKNTSISDFYFYEKAND